MRTKIKSCDLCAHYFLGVTIHALFLIFHANTMAFIGFLCYILGKLWFTVYALLPAPRYDRYLECSLGLNLKNYPWMPWNLQFIQHTRGSCFTIDYAFPKITGMFDTKLFWFSETSKFHASLSRSNLNSEKLIILIISNLRNVYIFVNVINNYLPITTNTSD